MQPQRETAPRVLIVEDEGVTAMDTHDRLLGMGYAVVASVFSAADAVRRATELRPDLVLMDIRLKGAGDGIAAAKEIRTRIDVPIIYTTAYADDATVQRAKVTEPFGYVLKPFDERELRTTIEVALYKHRMERQRTDFLAMLTHDIRGPLGVILGCTDLLEEELRNDNRTQSEDILGRLTSTTLSLHALVTNYLEASRLENAQPALERVPVSINDVARRVRDRYADEARRRRIRLTLALQDDLPPALADELAIDRVIANLVFNAIKFTPNDGEVTITSAANNGRIVVAVSDTGPGIPIAHLPQVFDRYQPTAGGRNGGGTGLGLFIVKTLVRAHAGTVDVRSNPGEGTRFTVSLSAA